MRSSLVAHQQRKFVQHSVITAGGGALQAVGQAHVRLRVLDADVQLRVLLMPSLAGEADVIAGVDVIKSLGGVVLHAGGGVSRCVGPAVAAVAQSGCLVAPSQRVGASEVTHTNTAQHAVRGRPSTSTDRPATIHLRDDDFEATFDGSR